MVRIKIYYIFGGVRVCAASTAYRDSRHEMGKSIKVIEIIKVKG